MSTMQASLFDSSPVRMPLRLGRTDVRMVEVNNILTKPSGKLAEFDYSLNPYRGCGFGCSYCYAAFFVPDDVSRDRWGEWVEVKANALQSLAKARNLEDKLILMSSATDPYQPVEMQAQITRGILEYFTEMSGQPRLVIQTRSPLVTRDIDLLAKLKNVRVNMSVTTDSEAVRRKFEPACASIDRRLEALRELKAAGIEIGVCISPMLPIEDPVQFARTLRDLDADRYATVYFHASDRLFSSNTGKRALELARELGWNRERFLRTKAILESLVPQFRNRKNAFATD